MRLLKSHFPRCLCCCIVAEVPVGTATGKDQVNERDRPQLCSPVAQEIVIAFLDGGGERGGQRGQ